MATRNFIARLLRSQGDCFAREDAFRVCARNDAFEADVLRRSLQGGKATSLKKYPSVRQKFHQACLLYRWSRRESNSGPEKIIPCLLHA